MWSQPAIFPAMKILTCNIRYAGAADGDNRWEKRRSLCADVIHSRAPDIICLQETWREQLDDLAAALPEFDSYGIIDEPLGKNPVNTIMYRRERFMRLSAGGFWLSETPHVTGSSSWDSACVRLANWLRLDDVESGSELRVVNTHLDHVSQVARQEQARVITEDARAYPDDYPQLLTGNLNCDADNPAIAVLESAGWVDTYATVQGSLPPGHTYHGFQGVDHIAKVGKMDWIFARGNIEARDAEIIDDAVDGRYPSDHYFIGADVEVVTR